MERIKFMHVVLVEPQIPQNTGNVARTCAVTGTSLHLVKPLGFSTDDKYLKRAGLDYWDKLDLHYYENFAEFLKVHGHKRLWFVETGSTQYYHEVEYKSDDFLIFGKETAGLDKEILQSYRDKWIKIPMLPTVRSLNLSNAVALVLYEALRQQNFKGLI